MLNVIMLSFTIKSVMLNVIMLSVVMLNGVMLNVMAPQTCTEPSINIRHLCCQKILNEFVNWPMEQCIFVQYWHKTIEGSSEKVTRKKFLTKIMSINKFLSVRTSLCSVQFFFSSNQRFLLHIYFSEIINCNTFSVAPSLINKDAKNVLFHLSEAIFQ